MAFETSTATNMSDLITKLNTFATANGWTSDQLDTTNGRLALHKGSCYVSFRWDPATPLHLSVHQALGYTGGNEPGNHPSDSGNGYNTTSSHTNTNLLTQRCVSDLGNGSFPSYHFFHDGSPHDHIHIVVQASAGVYRHFGFGNLDKFGDWTGGEYAYGHYHAGTPGNPVLAADTTSLDGLFLDAGVNMKRGATLHIEGITGEAGTSKWGSVAGAATGTTLPNDTAGNAKIDIQGGFRSGPVARHFGWLAAGTSTGLIPTYPIYLFYRDRATSFVYAIGSMPNVRGMNIKYFAGGEEVTVGSDIWIPFPLMQKTSSSVTNRSYNSGLFYKKVT